MIISKPILERELNQQLIKFLSENGHYSPTNITVSPSKCKHLEIVFGELPKVSLGFGSIDINVDDQQTDDYKLWKE